MKKRNLLSFGFVLAAFLLFLTPSVFAATSNSSGLPPFYYSKCLPIIFGGIFVVESLIIILFTDIKRFVNVSFAVVVANISSFVVIRLILGIIRHGVFFVGPLMYNTRPINWVIICGCFVLSLAIEIPIIWKMLNEFTNKTQWLIFIIVVANIVTFFATSFLEIALAKSIIY